MTTRWSPTILTSSGRIRQSAYELQNQFFDRDAAISADRTYPDHLTSVPNKLGSNILAEFEPSQFMKSMIRIASVSLAAYWLAIFVATHLPKSALPSLHWSDKAYHAIAFSGLSFLLAWALPMRTRWRHLLCVGAIALAYACLDEYTQRFIPGRASEVLDVVADAFGICIGLVAYTICRQILIAVTWGQRLIHSLSR